MNRNQLIAMWVGIGISVIIVLFTNTRFNSYRAIVVDYGPLLGRLAVTVVVTVAAIYSLRSKDSQKH